MKKSHLGIYRGYDLMEPEDATEEQNKKTRQNRGFWTAAIGAIF